MNLMKRNILLNLLFLLITATTFSQQKIDFKSAGVMIPNFSINLVPKGTLTPYMLKQNQPVLIMIFSPECEHCAHILDSLKMLRSSFKTTQVILVAEERHKKLMESFVEREHLKDDALFKYVGNSDNLIGAIYTYKVLPQLVFYDNKFRLVKIFDGNYKMDAVKKYVK